MWALAALAVGTAIQMYSQSKAADSQADAARRQAAMRNAQADEIERRARINMDILQEEGAVFVGQQTSGYAKAGVDIGSGSPLLELEYSSYKVNRSVANVFSEAHYKAQLVRAGAADAEMEASDIKQAANFNNGMTLLTSLYKGYSTYSGSGGDGAGSGSSPSSSKPMGTNVGNQSYTGSNSGYSGARFTRERA